MNEESESETAAQLILQDLTYHQKKLLYIVFGEDVPDRSFDHLSTDQTDHVQLETMKKMTLVEFHAGFEKSLDEESEQSKPINIGSFNPFGVYTITPNLMNRNADLAVCLPIRKNIQKLMRLSPEEDKIWIDNNFEIWRLVDLECDRLVTSLSSSARVLDALDEVMSCPTRLSGFAMERSNLFDANAYVDILEDVRGMSKFNESQRLAIESAQYLRDGFFVIQGPP